MAFSAALFLNSRSDDPGSESADDVWVLREVERHEDKHVETLDECRGYAEQRLYGHSGILVRGCKKCEANVQTFLNL